MTLASYTTGSMRQLSNSNTEFAAMKPESQGALHDGTVFGHIHCFEPAVLRPLERVFNFFLQLRRDPTLEGSL